ncbi:MAG: homoserine dehydrogenase [Clostridia bacterium]|nr:homoserine dehydrogenase [Clostridia bacterium]
MNIGLLGCGTIGSGVLELLDNTQGVKVLKVLDLPSKKDFLGERFAEKPSEVCENPEIDTVIEAMGGNQFPYECIKSALLNGKNVITSNKEVVSLHIEEFYALAKKANVYFLCEASVGGGIPLICSLIDSIKINKVNRIYGIINGTTNFILTKMDKEGVSLDEALSEAKRLGFAEFDATADLEGLDMTRKICILSSIAYGSEVKYSSIYHYGITKVTAKILSDIKSLGYTLKFVAESVLNGDTVKASVEPCLVDNSSPLGGVNYEFNAVYYHCEFNDTLGFYGKGAGKFPTASAMVADVKRIELNAPKYYFENNKEFKVENFLDSSKYYVFDGNKGKIIDKLDNVNNYEFVARIL